MTSQVGSGANKQRFFSPASIEWTQTDIYGDYVNGKYQARTAHPLTRSQEIALEEHRVYHERIGDFGPPAMLNKHIDLMRESMKEGSAFTVAHKWAITNGPKPNK